MLWIWSYYIYSCNIIVILKYTLLLKYIELSQNHVNGCVFGLKNNKTTIYIYLSFPEFFTPDQPLIIIVSNLQIRSFINGFYVEYKFDMGHYYILYYVKTIE